MLNTKLVKFGDAPVAYLSSNLLHFLNFFLKSITVYRLVS